MSGDTYAQSLSMTVTTTPLSNGDILQNIDIVGFEGVRERLFTHVLHTRDEQVRAALIALGWTPPKEAA